MKKKENNPVENEILATWESGGEEFVTDEEAEEIEFLRTACEELEMDCRVEAVPGQMLLLASLPEMGYEFRMFFSRLPDPLTGEGGKFLTIACDRPEGTDEITEDILTEFNLKSDVCGVNWRREEGILEYSMVFPAEVLLERPEELLYHALRSFITDMER